MAFAVRVRLLAGLNARSLNTGGSLKPRSQWSFKPENRKLRAGLMGRKLGMMRVYDNHGAVRPVTVIKVDSNVVVNHIEHLDKDLRPFTVMQVGYEEVRNFKRLAPQMRGYFYKMGVFPRKFLAEFRVHPDGLLPIGTKLGAGHFVPGQLIDVSGKTKGKGFAGVMKRHNMRGGRASHGASKSHRQRGSTGANQDPGKVFKGTRMAGRMGGGRITAPNLRIYKVDKKLDLIYVVGAVPGPKKNVVELKDALKARQDVTKFPWPTAEPYQPGEPFEFAADLGHPAPWIFPDE